MILDLFAGPGGWSEGLRMLSPELHATEIGMEWDTAACATRAAAGHRTIQTDVAAYPTAPFVGKVTGLIASPPCQDWSTAGNGAAANGDSGHLVREVMRWAVALEPEWIACEQVPPVLSVWQEYAAALRAHGYSSWSGVLDAADYGVPQNRLRAVLLASRKRPALPPEPTHDEHGSDGLWQRLHPAVTLADVMGLEPGWIYDSGQNSRAAGNTLVRYKRSCDRPAGTLTTKCTAQWVLRKDDDRRKLSLADAAAVQSFPDGYPFQGNTTERQTQIGNAVPPRLAAHVLCALTGEAA